ncbi:hypothetical protein BDN67DRAFT_985088 [Paxillus ammoniavirescens]|nr:hypothetical protein BDN67DRAFT_985088 [Paxillus ammoniavirescens]
MDGSHEADIPSSGFAQINMSGSFGNSNKLAAQPSAAGKHHQSYSPLSVIIPPPLGPLSKPNGGGYALRDVLGWNDTIYKSVQNGLHVVSSTGPGSISNSFNLPRPLARQRFHKDVSQK